MTTLLLGVGIVFSFAAAALLVRWFLAEFSTEPLLVAYGHSEEQGPAGFWPGFSLKPLVHSEAETDLITAERLFRQGCPCHLALLEAYGSSLGLSRGEVFEIQLGLSKQIDVLKTCGAVTGALTILKAQEEREEATSTHTQPSQSGSAQYFINRFTARWGSIYCKDLLGYDLSTAEGRETAAAKRLMETVCPAVVQHAASLTARLCGEGQCTCASEHRTLHKDTGLLLEEDIPCPALGEGI